MHKWVIHCHEFIRVGLHTTAMLGPYDTLEEAERMVERMKNNWAIPPKRVTVHSILAFPL